MKSEENPRSVVSLESDDKAFQGRGSDRTTEMLLMGQVGCGLRVIGFSKKEVTGDLEEQSLW